MPRDTFTVGAAKPKGALACATLLCLVYAVPANAAVTGTVVDEGGKPLAGPRLLISHARTGTRLAAGASDVITGPLERSVMADAQGSFLISNLPAGQYTVCVQISTPGFLDPCHWAPAAPTFSVSDGQSLSGLKLIVPRGAIMTIHIEDPAGLLNKNAVGRTDFDCDVHIITGKGLHYSAPLQFQGVNGRDHVITVPFGTPLKVQVLSPHFSIRDAAGGAQASQGTTFSVPAGNGSAIVNYTIAGRK